MTLKEFRKIIRGLPGEMDIAIDTEDGSLEPICGNIEVVELKFNETEEKRFVLVIKPCRCEEEVEELTENINLN